MKFKELDVKLVVKTGLYIGGYEAEYEIGGIDNTVIKLANGMPYVPGSSLKGRLKSVFYALGKKKEEQSRVFGSYVDKDGKTKQEENREIICIFRDLYLNEEKTDKELVRMGVTDLENVKESNYLELKTENSIDLSTGKAENPRPTERVIPGCCFEGKIAIVYPEGKEKEVEDIKKDLKEAAEKLSEFFYLGGSGTRGYGQVELTIKGTGEQQA